MTRLINKLDKVLLIASIIMFGFGLLMIYDASSIKSELEYGVNNKYLIRQIAFLVLSTFICIFIVQFPTKRYKKLIFPAVIISIVSLILLFPLGIEVNGAKSWYSFGLFTAQPSEFAKIVIIVFSGIFYQATSKVQLKWLKTSYAVIAGAIMTILTVAQPDAGTGLILFIIVSSLYFMSPVPKEHKLKSIIFGVIALVSFIIIMLILNHGRLLRPQQMSRFNFLKPCTRYQENTGYQVCNGYIAINNGKLISISPGNSKQKYLYLPEAYTDFIFPIIVEEFGLIPGILVILMYVLIIYRIILVGKRANNLANQLMCFGVAILLFSHVVINLVGVLGILPLTGVPLPFLSYGGSFALTVSVGLAIVQRVSIESYDSLKRKVLD